MQSQRAKCPGCRRVIPSEDIKVANDIALCRNCNLSHRFSALIAAAEADQDSAQPPPGTWRRSEGETLIIGARHRSTGMALALLAFGLFWNGIVGFFVAGAVGSTLHHLGLPLPHWMPPQLAGSMPAGITIFLWLFLAPFIAMGLFFVATLVSCLAGRTELRLQGNEATIFAGVGKLGIRRRFATSEVRDVRIEERSWRDNEGYSQQKTQIVVETNRKSIRFGTMLPEERRRFLAAAVKRELVRIV